MKHHPWLDLG